MNDETKQDEVVCDIVKGVIDFLEERLEVLTPQQHSAIEKIIHLASDNEKELMRVAIKKLLMRLAGGEFLRAVVLEHDRPAPEQKEKPQASAIPKRLIAARLSPFYTDVTKQRTETLAKMLSEWDETEDDDVAEIAKHTKKAMGMGVL